MQVEDLIKPARKWYNAAVDFWDDESDLKARAKLEKATGQMAEKAWKFAAELNKNYNKAKEKRK